MHFMVELPSKLILLTLSVVTMIAADCDNSIVPELTFRLGGNNLDWPEYATKNIYTTSNRYIPKNIIATRSQIYRDTAFVAIPRYRSGVPFTLARVDLRKGKCSVPMAPYPCWASQEEGNCQALQNVVDIFLDRQVCVQPKMHKTVALFHSIEFLYFFLLFDSIFILGYSMGTGYGYC